MSKVYTPQRNSQPGKVITYFLANPSEELTTIDIAHKYNVSSHGIRASLAQAVDAKLLVLARNDVLDFVYGPGKLIDTMAKDPAPGAPAPKPPVEAPTAPLANKPEAVSSTPPAGLSTSTTGLSTPLPGLDKIVIEDGVPLPPTHGSSGRTALMAALLVKLKPEQSAPLPLNYHACLAHAQAKAHKAKAGTYTIRTNRQTDTLRVWRVA